jgi:hypothetical protein
MDFLGPTAPPLFYCLFRINASKEHQSHDVARRFGDGWMDGERYVRVGVVVIDAYAAKRRRKRMQVVERAESSELSSARFTGRKRLEEDFSNYLETRSEICRKI